MRITADVVNALPSMSVSLLATAYLPIADFENISGNRAAIGFEPSEISVAMAGAFMVVKGGRGAACGKAFSALPEKDTHWARKGRASEECRLGVCAIDSMAGSYLPAKSSEGNAFYRWHDVSQGCAKWSGIPLRRHLSGKERPVPAGGSLPDSALDQSGQGIQRIEACLNC